MEQKNLTQALVAAQAQFLPAPKNGRNPHFKSSFSTLEDLIESSRDILVRVGLAVTQYPDSDGAHMYLVTRLKHISGEEITSRALMVLKDPSDIQKLGSAISYIKRYAYAAICGIATSDSDDDGNTTTTPSQAEAVTKPHELQTTNGAVYLTAKSDFISPKQFGYLRAKIKDANRSELDICRKYQITSLDKLPWKKMQEVLDSLMGPPAVQQSALDPQFEEVIEF